MTFTSRSMSCCCFIPELQSKKNYKKTTLLNTQKNEITCAKQKQEHSKMTQKDNCIVILKRIYEISGTRSMPPLPRSHGTLHKQQQPSQRPSSSSPISCAGLAETSRLQKAPLTPSNGHIHNFTDKAGRRRR